MDYKHMYDIQCPPKVLQKNETIFLQFLKKMLTVNDFCKQYGSRSGPTKLIFFLKTDCIAKGLEF